MPRRLARRVGLAAAGACCLLATTPPAAALPLPPEAVELRNRGLAQLENEQPVEAEQLFRQLADKVPDDPLPWANLAVALLRQQRHAEALAAADRALAADPGRGDLLAIRGEILQWSGQTAAAVAALRQAAAAAPRDPAIQYALLRQAGTALDEAAAAEALDRLAGLRPENLLVLLEQGRRAVEAGDRSGATRAFLRIDELLWQAPAAAAQVMGQVSQALARADLAAARVPALRLENVLKVTPMYQQGLRELSTGIQANPVLRFLAEPPPAVFGEGLPVRFEAIRLDGAPLGGHPLTAADLEGDGAQALAWIAGGELKVQPGSGGPRRRLAAAGSFQGLLAADLDNDGHLDLLAFGPQGLAVWRGGPGGALTAATEAFGLTGRGGAAAAVLDFDIEGDLDLAVAGDAKGGVELMRNTLAGPLEPVGAKSLPALSLGAVSDLAAGDLDRDGDVDLLVAHGQGLAWLDNLRQGRFTDRTAAAGLAAAPPARAVAVADLDADGWLDLVLAGAGLTLLRNRHGRFEPYGASPRLVPGSPLAAVLAFDADNDGRLDLAVAGRDGVRVLVQRDAGGFEERPVGASPVGVTALTAADLDRDGDLDLAAGGAAGLHRLTNEGGNRNHWLAVRLRGLAKGNSKNNLFGLGGTVEAWTGSAYQFREVTADTTWLGLGRQPAAAVLRVVWTNGVPQNRFEAKADQWIVEEQVLKGSCPFLYAWDGERVAFVTDLLWGAPLGLPIAPGLFAAADPSELVRVDAAAPRAGVYDLRVTEELWEAAFLDHLRLWVVDHPAGVEVASNLRILPGRSLPETVLGARAVRPVAAAWDAAGEEVTERLRRRDEVYAGGWEKSPYQGVAARPWALTVDLGEAPGGPVRLLLDAWIFPADASLNLAVAQRPDLTAAPPRLEVETANGWEPLLDEMGFPAGKTKTMVVDTPRLPAGARRLRIVTGQWLSFDRIAWTDQPADGEPRVLARLAPAAAYLRFRGFSALSRRSPDAPHTYDYSQVSRESPWLAFPGRYTRYGDVTELLAAPDDRSAILAAGDEIALAFDATALPPPPPGWRRTVFLESHGWDKDADRNTWEAQRLEPLPFRAMSGYPYGEGESFPDTPELRDYRERWLTREVEAAPPGP